MDNPRRAEQIAKADKLMSQLNDADWLRQHPAEEIEGDGWVEAGNGLQAYVDSLKQLSTQDVRGMKVQVRVLSMLLPVLRDWLISWELGASFETVYIEAQTLLFQHIQQASTAQESWIEELISAHEQGVSAEDPLRLLQLRERLSEILTQENWQVLARVAAQDMEKRILQHSQAQLELPAAV